MPQCHCIDTLLAQHWCKRLPYWALHCFGTCTALVLYWSRAGAPVADCARESMRKEPRTQMAAKLETLNHSNATDARRSCAHEEMRQMPPNEGLPLKLVPHVHHPLWKSIIPNRNTPLAVSMLFLAANCCCEYNLAKPNESKDLRSRRSHVWSTTEQYSRRCGLMAARKSIRNNEKTERR